jgi:hypothetical protein
MLDKDLPLDGAVAFALERVSPERLAKLPLLLGLV